MIKYTSKNPTFALQGRCQLSLVFMAVLFLLSLLAFSIPTAKAQGAPAVEIASGTLDNSGRDGPGWMRIDFEPLVSGAHTIRATWDGDANIRFAVYRINGDNNQRVGKTASGDMPAVLTSSLDSSEEYYLAIWSVSGSADFTATIEADPEEPSTLEITSQPADQNVDDGDRATFSVTADGDGSLEYQWFVVPAPMSDGDGMTIFPATEIAGATNRTLAIDPATASDNGNAYFVDVSDASNNTVRSRQALLTVDEEPATTLVITEQPRNLTVTEGDSATFTVEADGSGTLEYQWLVGGNNIAGATNASYTVSSASLSDDGRVYRVDVTDDNDTIRSNSARLTVNEDDSPTTGIEIGEGTVDDDRQAGPRWTRVDFDSLGATTHTISVVWDSDADVRYTVREANGRKISPTIRGTNPGVWTGVLEANEEYYLGLWATSGSANYTATIEADDVPVGEQLTIVSQPSNVTVNEGSNATFSVEVDGGSNLDYQWFADGDRLNGEDDDTLTVRSVSLSDNGTLYSVDVSNGTQTVTSRDAKLTVNSRPTNNGVTARWQMNERAGASVIRDSSGNGHNGTIGSDVVTGDSDRGATSYRWLFTSPTADYEPERIVNVPHDADLNPGSGDYSITMRYRTNVSFGNIIQKGQGGSSGGYWKIENPGGRLTCVFRGVKNGDWNRKEVVSSRPLNDGQYHTITCERVGRTLRLIVDGVIDDTAGNSTGSISNNRPISIGGKTNCNNTSTSCDYFTGWIDEISIDAE